MTESVDDHTVIIIRFRLESKNLSFAPLSSVVLRPCTEYWFCLYVDRLAFIFNFAVFRFCNECSLCFSERSPICRPALHIRLYIRKILFSVSQPLSPDLRKRIVGLFITSFGLVPLNCMLVWRSWTVVPPLPWGALASANLGPEKHRAQELEW